MSKNKPSRKRDNQNNQPSLKEKLADAIDISKNVMLGVPLVTMVGDRELPLKTMLA